MGIGGTQAEECKDNNFMNSNSFDKICVKGTPKCKDAVMKNFLVETAGVSKDCAGCAKGYLRCIIDAYVEACGKGEGDCKGKCEDLSTFAECLQCVKVLEQGIKKSSDVCFAKYGVGLAPDQRPCLDAPKSGH